MGDRSACGWKLEYPERESERVAHSLSHNALAEPEFEPVTLEVTGEDVSTVTAQCLHCQEIIHPLTLDNTVRNVPSLLLENISSEFQVRLIL